MADGNRGNHYTNDFLRRLSDDVKMPGEDACSDILPDRIVITTELLVMPGRHIIRFATIAITTILLIHPLGWAQQAAISEAQDQFRQDRAYQKELKREAALNLYRLKRSIEKDGFYSARIALNIWRSTSLKAGTFDAKVYDDLKTQLYEKAMKDSLACYQYFMRLKDANNAKTCMLIWRSHAKEIDRYDPTAYQQLQEGIEGLKKKK